MEEGQQGQEELRFSRTCVGVKAVNSSAKTTPHIMTLKVFIDTKPHRFSVLAVRLAKCVVFSIFTSKPALLSWSCTLFFSGFRRLTGRLMTLEVSLPKGLWLILRRTDRFFELGWQLCPTKYVKFRPNVEGCFPSTFQARLILKNDAQYNQTLITAATMPLRIHSEQMKEKEGAPLRSHVRCWVYETKIHECHSKERCKV